ncbi:MAG: SMI1/KNR4 family protein [Caloramator sp.]|nr:SMI1/KNR4 family protein [Caloramator sp.]
MAKGRLEKFEMKYGYFLPNEYKQFIYKFGGDVQFGSCRFEYPENIAANILRIPGKMDFRLLPFGDISNGDLYCFYKYGPEVNDYFIGLYLHETSNFVILSSNFESFLYRCMLDDYFASINGIDEYSFEENISASNECIERCNILSKEYGFDLNEVKQYKTELDYHRLMVNRDKRAVQSLCYLGKYYLENGDFKKGVGYINMVIKTCSNYFAPYYILGRHLIFSGKMDGYAYLKKSLKKSLCLTGYSYWQEDFIDIPEDAHREVALFIEDMYDYDDLLEGRLMRGIDPYDAKLRKILAEEYLNRGRYKNALEECANALYCSDNDKDEILNLALKVTKASGDTYLTKIIENDIKNLSRKVL